MLCCDFFSSAPKFNHSMSHKTHSHVQFQFPDIVIRSSTYLFVTGRGSRFFSACFMSCYTSSRIICKLFFFLLRFPYNRFQLFGSSNIAYYMYTTQTHSIFIYSVTMRSVNVLPHFMCYLVSVCTLYGVVA